MKKITKILIITIISLLFINNAKADTTITFQSFPVIDAYMQETGGTIEDFRNIVMKNIEKPDDFDDYAHYVVLMKIGNNNSFTIYFWLSDRFNFAKNTNLLYLRDGQYDIRNSKRYSSGSNAFTFNNDYTEISFNGTWNDNTTYFLPFTNPLNYMILASDLDEIQYATPTWQTDNFIIGNNSYNLNDYIPLSDLNYYGLNVINYYSLPPQPTKPVCNATQVVGMFENPSEFDVTISGTGNALKENLEGLLTIFPITSSVLLKPYPICL